MNPISKILPLAIICLNLLACSHSELSSKRSLTSEITSELSEPTLSPSFSVIALTDFHGALESDTAIVGVNQTVRFGGADTLAAYVQRLRGRLGPNLLIDGGDLFQGTMLSNQFEGAPVIRFYNALKVDAVAIGNHEFDFGPEGEKTIPMVAGDDPRGALKLRIREAHFPFLSLNIKDSKNQIPSWVKPSIVKGVNGVSVGIIGISDPSTPSTTNALNLVGLEFMNVPDTAQAILQEAKRLREVEGVKSVVLTSHLGAICKNNSLEKLDDLSSCESSPLFEILKLLPPGTIDISVAGHTHRVVIKRVNHTLVLQSGSSGKYLSWGSVQIRPQLPNNVTFGGLSPVCVTVLKGEGFESCDPFELKDKKGELANARFLGDLISPDPSIPKLYEKELNEIIEKKNSPIGKVSLDQEFMRSYGAESVLGNLVADIQKQMHPKADIGMTNGGGLRANLPKGPLIYDHVFKLMPFDNQLAVIVVSPKQLEHMIKIGTSGKSGAYIYSDNLRFELKKCIPQNVRVNGKLLTEFRPGHVFHVAMSDFLAGGGSGMKELKLPKEAITTYWEKENLLREGMVRILKSWDRPLTAVEFMNPASPRQVVVEPCL